MSEQRLYRLALRDLHAAAGATFVTAGDWSLPAHYGNAGQEHAALRTAAAVFDRSQRSRIMVTGTDAETVLGSVFAGHVDELEEGRALRSVWLDELGHVGDLALIARTGGIAYLVSGEPGQREATLARLSGAVGPDFDVRIEDRTETTCAIAVAGPRTADVAAEHLAGALSARIRQLQCATFEFHGFRTLAVRTSDVGEDGLELLLAPPVAQHLVETLRAAGVPLAGQEAQEAARVESCIPAFQPDLEGGLTPAEADLDVLLDVPGGSDSRILSAVIVDGPVLDAGTRLTRAGEDVGELRSCVRSHALDATVGLAVVESRVAAPGATLDARGNRATIVAKPFYRRRGS